MGDEPSTKSAASIRGIDLEELRILRFPDVVKKTGLSKSAIYERIRSREFPEAVPLGARAVGFVAQEVDQWLQDLITRSRCASAQTGQVH